MNEYNPNWLSDLRKQEAEDSAKASAIIEKHLKNTGLLFKKTGETTSWSMVGWDLYTNIHELLGDAKHAEMLRAMFVELIDFCEIATSESFAYKLKILFEKFIGTNPPRSKLMQLLPAKAIAQFNEIEQMLDDDHERYIEILNQQGY